MAFHLTQPESFLIAMLIIFSVPYLLWRHLKTDYYAPMVVVQIVAGIVLGPDVLGAYCGNCYNAVFSATTTQNLNGIAAWAVMIFVFVAGLELDLSNVWRYRRESGITAGLALGVPLSLGAIVGYLLSHHAGWAGPLAHGWQFTLAIGMSCSITALPILIIFLEKMELLRQPIGQRVLRYASLDDILIWSVLAVVLLDLQRLKTQLIFLVTFGLAAIGFRKLMARLTEADRWFAAIIWLAVAAFMAEWSGLHFMVGAFLAGVVIDLRWFEQKHVDLLRHYVLLLMMPVFFLSTGLKTHWSIGGAAVFAVAGLLLLAAVAGKLIGVHLAGRILKWDEGEAAIIGWLLQSKSLITIVFADVLLDKGIISGDAFTALLIMSLLSTMLTVPVVSARLASRPGLAAKVS
ncbi:cation:proton antiporter [Dyella sp. M7H15-1]|uniref:cation:proton antiporter n=1 Tax=Dyella sp. M7H15-1 TaxID=2501295 RepID=UPI001F0CD2C1|nr:cation:proton antiporter [Dyella sp. M7H15-1]